MWRIRKIKGRWWLIRPATHQTPWVAEHVGTYQECVEKFRDRSTH